VLRAFTKSFRKIKHLSIVVLVIPPSEGHEHTTNTLLTAYVIICSLNLNSRGYGGVGSQ